tara:strand:- start:93 stop:296 length:204 start_codon:yes stop_codon:yes gene_type:complete
MDSYEIYYAELGEARACGVRDFPTYKEWLHNLTTPNAERIRAEERIEMRESWKDQLWIEESVDDDDY